MNSFKNVFFFRWIISFQKFSMLKANKSYPGVQLLNACSLKFCTRPNVFIHKYNVITNFSTSNYQLLHKYLPTSPLISFLKLSKRTLKIYDIKEKHVTLIQVSNLQIISPWTLDKIFHYWSNHIQAIVWVYNYWSAAQAGCRYYCY